MMPRIWNEETHTHGFHQELFLIQLVSKKILSGSKLEFFEKDMIRD